jgi:hypothetical protein
MSEPKSEYLYMTCESRGHVPFIHRGPQVKPMRLLRTKFEALENMGYKVTEVEDPQGAFGGKPRPVKAAPVEETSDETITEPQTPPAENTEENDPAPSEVSESTEEETVTDPVDPESTDDGTTDGVDSELVTESDGTVVEETRMTKEVLDELNKDQLKKLMDENEIEYAYADTKTVLIQAILDFQG